MTHPNHNPLLRDLIAGEESAGLRERSLARLLAAARARRHHRRVRTAVGLFALLFVAGALLLRPPISSSPETASLPVSPVAPATAAVAASRPAPEVEYVTDDDLLALMPNRRFALVGPPGRQTIIFLDNNRAAN